MKKAKKSRQILTVFYIWEILISIIGLIIYLLGRNALVTYTGSLFYLDLFIFIASLAAVYGLWNWKKWGIYLLVIAYILKIFETILIFRAGSLIFNLIYILVFFWFINKKMKNFS